MGGESIPASTVIAYGRGRGGRRVSWCAGSSLALPLVLWGFAAWLYLGYRAEPPPSSGFAGAGWLIAMLALFGGLVIATVVLAPLSFALAAAALWMIRRRPQHLFGRRLARGGIILSAGMVVAVCLVKFKFDRWVSAATAAKAAAGATAAAAGPTAEQYAVYGETTAAERLAHASQVYAMQHGGHYPDDMAGLGTATDGKCRPEFLAQYVYVGNGLTYDRAVPDAARDAENMGLVLIVRRQPLPGNRWVVGVHGHPLCAHGMIVSASELTGLIRQTNRIRAARHLPPIDFEGPPGDAVATPVTPPAPPPASPQP